jgi:cell division protein FtsW (lipid II flippase)
MCRPKPGRNWNSLLANTIRKATSGPLAVSLLFGLMAIFVGVALFQLALVNNNIQLTTFVPLLGLLACSGTVVFVLYRFRPTTLREPLLLPLTFFLSGLGLVMITRLAPSFTNRQIVWLILGAVMLLLVTLLPRNLNWLYRYKYTWLIGGLLLLASTLVFGVNPSGFGARLWLEIGGFYFQPSELLKLLLLIFLAAYLADRRHYLINARAYVGAVPVPHPAYLGPMLLMWGFSIVLLVWQRDLGAALLFFATFLAMLYIATGQSRYLWAGGILLIIGGTIGYALFDVVRIRVEGFLDPLADPAGRSFQIIQSLLAFASGGVLGEGLGQGLPTAIPVVHTDFVFAAIAEEYGLFGSVGVLLLFALLIGRAFHIAMIASTDFEQLLASGIGTMLGLQTLVIMAGTLKLMPLTGVTLPFVSYGGSSLIISYVMIGLLLFIAGRADGQTPASTRLPIYHLQLAQGIFTGLLIVAGGIILWQVVLAPFLISRTDNPRRVVAEQRVDRGRLLTRNGVPVAETVIGEDGIAQRRYPYSNLSSVTGYYSLRYGVGGTEAAFDAILRGTANLSDREQLLNALLHRPLRGDDVSLTIDLPAQVTADVALGDQEGAVVVLDISTGEVLVMSSHPTYDPNMLNTEWDTLRLDDRAPLLNRATQGLYPVGDLARLIAIIGLYETDAVLPELPLDTSAELLAAPLGAVGYRATAYQLGLADFLPGIPSQPARLPNLPPTGRETVRELAVSPLHLAQVMVMLARDGERVVPTLSLGQESVSVPTVRPETAGRVLSQLLQTDQDLIGLSGQATPEETGRQSLNWYVGLAPIRLANVETDVRLSAAIGDDGSLILDPTQIPFVESPVSAEGSPVDAAYTGSAKFAIVTVVVTDSAEEEPARQIARTVIANLLERDLPCCD